jgi:predicted HD phosphohydrolase
VAALRRKYEAPILGEVRVWDQIQRLALCIDPTDSRLYTTSQLTHVLQVIEAMESDGVLTPDLLLAALVHDLGKLLLLTDEDPANVVCMNHPIGDYPDGVGLDNVVVQWNHDELGYSRLVGLVPDRVSWLVRYHSLDPVAHRPLMDDRDRGYAELLELFFHYDHDTKSAYHRPTIRIGDYRDIVEAAFPEPILF